MAGIKDFFSGFGFGDALDSLGNLVGAIGNIVSSKKNREVNEKLTRETNENNRKMQESANATNLQIADNANALQREESEKAYERSKAGNQVNLMTQAGMSRAGAINALNGGGSYTPAPVNTAQVGASKDEVPQGNPTDFSGLINAFASLSANQAQYRNTKAQIKAQAEAQEREIQAQRDAQEREIRWQREKWSAENARAEYEQTLKKLSVDARNAASAIESFANPADYDTPAAYRKALYLKADPNQRKYFDNADFTNALDLYHAANASAKSVAASTEGTKATTAYTKADTKRIQQVTKQLKAEFDEWNSITGKDSREAELQARKVHADLLKLADEYDYNIKESDYQALVSDQIPDGPSISSQANEFWREVFRCIPLESLAQILRLIMKK